MRSFHQESGFEKEKNVTTATAVAYRIDFIDNTQNEKESARMKPMFSNGCFSTQGSH